MATLEYAALGVLLSAVLAVGGATVDAQAIPLAVGAQIRKAFCLVSGGDCFARGGSRPCVVGSRSELTEHRVKLALVRLRDGRTVLVESLSDGTRRVSVTQATGAGAGLALGGKAHLFGRGFDAQAEVEAAASVGYARTFVVPDAAAAKRLVERLDEEDVPVGGALPGLVRFARGGGPGGEVERTALVTSHGEAETALKGLGLGPAVAVLRQAAGSVRIDRRSGDVGVGLKLGGETLASLGALVAQGGAGSVSSWRAELVFDARRRPRELVLVGAAGIHGEAKLMTGDVAGGDLREVQARLDLADPAARALVDRVVGGDLGATRALARRLADRARIDVRHFATERDERWLGGEAAGIGAERYEQTESMRLVAAEGREPGLGWSRRLDCVLSREK